MYNPFLNGSSGGGGGGTTDKVRYAIEKILNGSSEYSAQYRLKETLNDTVISYPGNIINIPKDMVVQSGTVETCETDDVPVVGYVVGNKYIDLVIANSDDEHIYILLSDLIDLIAENVSFDDTELQNITADNVQEAIEQIHTKSYKIVTLEELEITTTGKTTLEVLKEIDALNLGLNTVVKGQWETTDLPSSDLGNAEVTIYVNKTSPDTVFNMTLTSTDIYPNEWQLMYRDGRIVMDWRSISASLIPDSTNINDYTVEGKYYSGDATSILTYTNAPFTEPFGLQVVKTGDESGIQFAFSEEEIKSRFFVTVDGVLSQIDDWHTLTIKTTDPTLTPCLTGELCVYDGDLYVAVATNTWQKVALSEVDLTAENVSYNNTESGAVGINVQQVLDNVIDGTTSVGLANNIRVSLINPITDIVYYPVFVDGTTGLQAPEVNDGLRYRTKEGTLEADGLGRLIIGNYIPSGTAGNKKGEIVFYNKMDKYVTIVANDNQTSAGITLTLPLATGTLALASSVALAATAAGTSYVNTTSGLTAITVQAAIDELKTLLTTGLDEKAKKATKETFSLEVASWVDNDIVISMGGVTANSIIDLSVPTDITSTQLDALLNAKLVPTNQAAGTFTLTAFGTIPTVTIPLVAIIGDDV